MTVEGVGEVVQKWLLPTLSEVLASSEQTGMNTVALSSKQIAENGHRRTSDSYACAKGERTARERLKAEREWWAAIAALEHLLLQASELDKSLPIKKLVLAGPVPVLSHPTLLSICQTWIFTPEAFKTLALMPFHLLPATAGQTQLLNHCAHSLPLLTVDPLAAEQFCLVLTPSLSVVMVLGEDLNGIPAFQFSFDPEVIEQAWTALRSRLLLANSHLALQHLDCLVERLPFSPPDYRTVMQFSRLMLKHLPEEDIGQMASHPGKKGEIELRRIEVSTISNPESDDVEMLQAFVHEVRTPLTTIRTLIRLLLRRQDLAPDVIKRLEIIDRECTEQIDRMELIFRAVELETSEVKQATVHLTAISLSQLLENCIPRWEKQASRRNLTLKAIVPQKLPAVVSNPNLLDQVLSGLIENFTRSLPGGIHIEVKVMPAGNQLKLQLLSEPHPDEIDKANASEKGVKSIGQLLMFQPETGNISLNLNVTKNLFQALGGKLIVRQRPQQSEVLTIFLPLH